MKEWLACCRRNKGAALVALIMAIMILGGLAAVLSYIMGGKQRTEPLYVQSMQSYAVAQAGIEYGIRYATDNISDFLDNPNTCFPLSRSFGNGSFSLHYFDSNDPDMPNTLTSLGTVGVGERKIILNNFTGWVLGGGISLDPGNPPYVSYP